nr:MAG TPA: hypothetical protein [Caudoviricetes sp.]
MNPLMRKASVIIALLSFHIRIFFILNSPITYQ